MRSAVLDTNVIISALLSSAGPPAAVMDLAFYKQFRCYISEEIRAEYRAVLGRQRLGIDPQHAAKFLVVLKQRTIVVTPTRKVRACADASNNQFLECALEAREDYIVTGKVRHFPERYQDIRVILPRQFITVLAADPR